MATGNPQGTPIVHEIEQNAELATEGNTELEAFLPTEITGHDGRIYWYTETGTVWSVGVSGQDARQEYDLDLQNVEDGNTSIRLRDTEVQVIEQDGDGSFREAFSPAASLHREEDEPGGDDGADPVGT
ncbi:MAG: hypothetical protein WBB15_13640, partial [Ornithinimicrobium sp.]